VLLCTFNYKNKINIAGHLHCLRSGEVRRILLDGRKSKIGRKVQCVSSRIIKLYTYKN